MGNRNSGNGGGMRRANTVDDWSIIQDRRQQFEGSHPKAKYSYSQLFEPEISSVRNIGICVLAGTRYEECQDNAIVVTKHPQYVMVGVFDGHGPKGHTVARRLVVEAKLAFEDHLDHVLELLETGPEKQMGEFSDRVHNIFDNDKKYLHSGSTATIALIEEGKIHFGWVGDSTAVLFTIKEDNVTPLALTKDHDLSTPEEVEHIEKHGGRVEQDGPNVKRMFDRHKSGKGPALAMSRAVGDVAAKKYGARFDFEYNGHTVEAPTEGEEQILLVASDGLWNVFSMEEIGALVLKHREAENLGEALAIEAREEWLRHIKDIDDVSVVALRV